MLAHQQCLEARREPQIPKGTNCKFIYIRTESRTLIWISKVLEKKDEYVFDPKM